MQTYYIRYIRQEPIYGFFTREILRYVARHATRTVKAKSVEDAIARLDKAVSAKDPNRCAHIVKVWRQFGDTTTSWGVVYSQDVESCLCEALS